MTRSATETESTLSPSASANRQEVVNGRYRVIRKLGSGGLGSVYLVEDSLRDNRQLALKRLHPGAVNKRTQRTLQTEFLVLSALRHPGLAEVYDFGKDTGTGGLFFTSAYVQGVELFQYCRGLDLKTPQGMREFFAMTAQVLRALEFVHSRGIVHGDLKPENILVQSPPVGSDETVEATSKLIDFGLVRQEKDFVGRNVMGTLYYVAPEVISGSQIDRRTDLYSFGALLYVLVTRKPLFDAKSQLSILKCQLDRVPVRPQEHVPGLDPRFGSLIMALLEKIPARRPQNAAEVLFALDEIAGGKIPIETDETTQSYLTNPRIEAHQRHTRTLFQACVSKWKRRPREGSDLSASVLQDNRQYVPFLGQDRSKELATQRTVFLRGERGMGEDNLIRSYKSLVQIHGGTWLSVDCQASRAEEQPGECHDFRALLRECVSIEMSLSNAQNRHDVAARFLKSQIREPDQEQIPQLKRSLLQLANYLLRLSNEAPLALHIDKVDKASPVLLLFIQAMVDAQVNPQTPEHQMFLSAWAREDCMDLNGSVADYLDSAEQAENATVIRIERLDNRQTRQMVDTMLQNHAFPEPFLRKVAINSDGNPGSVVEIFQHLLSEKSLVRTIRGWRLDEEVIDPRLPVHLRSELMDTITSLPQEAQRIGCAYAYLGNDTELELAADFSRLSLAEARRGARALVDRRILRGVVEGEEENFSFNYKTAQKLLYDMVPEDQRKVFHKRAGMLSRNERPDLDKTHPDRLARHFVKAEDLEESLHYCELAARYFSKQFRLDRAVRVYKDLFHLAEKQGAKLQPEKHRDLARYLSGTGRYREALDVLEKLLKDQKGELSETGLAEIHVDLAEAMTTLGDFEGAHERISSALTITDNAADPYTRRQRASTLLAKAKLSSIQGQYIESIKDCQTVRTLSSRSGDNRTLGEALSVVAENYFALGNLKTAASFCQEALCVFDDINDSVSRESALYSLARLYKYRDRFSEARMVLLFCAELRGKMGARDAEAQALSDLGGLALFLGRIPEARQTLGRAIKLFRITGNRPALLKALNLQSEVLRTTGEYEESKKTLVVAAELAEDLGTPVGESEAKVVEARLALDRGNLAKAQELIENSFPCSPSQPRSYLKALDLRCQIHSYKGDFSNLHVLAAEGLELAQANGLPLHEARFLEHLGTTHLRLGNARQAKEAARNLVQVAKQYSFPLSQGRAIMVKARIAETAGYHQLAIHHFLAAREMFLAQTSERDLIRLYTYMGGFLIERGDHAKAFCYLEEGLYLAKKLKLQYWECRLTYLAALLQVQSEDGSPEKAQKPLERAAEMAQRGPYGDLLWKIQRLQVSLRPGAGSYFTKQSAAKGEQPTGLNLKPGIRKRL